MASGQLMAAFGPLDAFPAASNFPTLSARNAHPLLDFDATTDETCYFEGTLPPSYSGGGLTVTIYWVAATATSGITRWQAAWERMVGGLDIDADSFATANSAGSTTNATSGVITTTVITFTNGAQIDSLAAGEPFRLSVNRDADATTGTDSMAGDAELVRVIVTET